MLSVSKVSKRYGEVAVFSDLSLTVNPGEVVFLTGPSGRGKSTALRVIANLEPADAGMVALHTPAGVLNSSDGPAWRAACAYVPQARITQPGTPAELFVRAGRFSSRAERPDVDVEELVRVAGSIGLESDCILRQSWAQLSGGQAQRAAVALVLALRPQVLLLDEPTSSCDVHSARLVEKAIASSKLSALWVSHDPQQPKRVDGRIISL